MRKYCHLTLFWKLLLFVTLKSKSLFRQQTLDDFEKESETPRKWHQMKFSNRNYNY